MNVLTIRCACGRVTEEKVERPAVLPEKRLRCAGCGQRGKASAVVRIVLVCPTCEGSTVRMLPSEDDPAPLYGHRCHFLRKRSAGVEAVGVLRRKHSPKTCGRR